MARGIDWLLDNLDKPNIAVDLDDTVLNKIASRVKYGYDLDDQSRSEWCEKTEIGLKIAEQITEKKTYPWPDAANVKFPLIATASIQFAARAYPNIIQGTEVVKTKVVGEDPDGKKADRAKRIRKHMSYQCTEEMEEWEEDVDKLLHALPVIGTCFKKTYFSTLLQRNVSEFVGPLDLVVNQSATSLETARRVTQKVYLYRNDVLEREGDGMFLERNAEYMQTDVEKEESELFLEQHGWYDLDEDGYEEPYIFTVHEATGTLVRIVARFGVEGIQATAKGRIKKITPVQFYTMFGFIPSPSKKFYYLGFAHLLGPINESMNTVINQLLDAGSLANLQSGFLAKGIRFQGGALRFKPGEWKTVDVTGGILKDNIFPLPVKEPSNVLFQLLGLLNDTGMKLASVSESMTGDAPPQNTPAATTLAMIEQGLKVFTAIYKRVYRSLSQEFKKLYRLNALYLDDKQYFRVLDTEYAIAKADYNIEDVDIFPVADPSLASEAQKIAKSQALMQTLQLNPSRTGQMEILRQHYEAIGAENIDKILPEEEIKQMMNAPPPPDPKVMQVQLDATKSQFADMMAERKLPYEIEKLESEIDEIKARTSKIVADIAAMPIKDELQRINDYVDRVQQDTKLEIERLKAERMGQKDGGEPTGGPVPGDQPQSDAGGTGGMAPPPDDQAGSVLPGPNPQELVAASGAGGDIESQLGGTNGDADYAGVGESLRRESGVEP